MKIKEANTRSEALLSIQIWMISMISAIMILAIIAPFIVELFQ